MTTLSGRLGRAQAGLSGHERAVMILRALRSGEEPNPGLRVIDDPAQRRIFDRCMGYMNAANSELHSIVQNLLFQAAWLEQSHQIRVLEGASQYAKESLGESVNPRKVRNWRKAKSVNTAEFLAGVAEEVRRDTLEVVVALSRELRAVELVREELAAEFEGEDLTLPEVLAVASEVKTKLLKVRTDLNGFVAAAVPTAEQVDGIRDRLEHVFRYWRLIEIRPDV